MPRTAIAVTKLNNKSGVFASAIPIDSLNGMTMRNTGVEVLVLQTGTGSSVTLTMPSTPDPFGRSGPVVITQGASLVGYYGPFAPANIWGDGASQLEVNAGVVTGTASIAAISI